MRSLRIDIIAILATGVLAGCISALIKLLVHAPRPDGYNGAGYSLPSNHATMAAASLVLLALLAQEYPWLRAHASARVALWMLCMAGAILIAWYRVHSGAHHPVDVIAGFALGSVVALLAWYVLRRVRG